MNVLMSARICGSSCPKVLTVTPSAFFSAIDFDGSWAWKPLSGFVGLPSLLPTNANTSAAAPTAKKATPNQSR